MQSGTYSPRLAESLRKIFDKLTVLLGNLLLHHETVAGALQPVADFFKICAFHNLNTDPEKWPLFAQFAKQSGGFRTEKGMNFDPRRIEGLLQIRR